MLQPPTAGLYYRPWLRTLTWLLFYAFSVFSFVIGCELLWLPLLLLPQGLDKRSAVLQSGQALAASLPVLSELSKCRQPRWLLRNACHMRSVLASLADLTASPTPVALQSTICTRSYPASR